MILYHFFSQKMAEKPPSPTPPQTPNTRQDYTMKFLAANVPKTLAIAVLKSHRNKLIQITRDQGCSVEELITKTSVPINWKIAETIVEKYPLFTEIHKIDLIILCLQDDYDPAAKPVKFPLLSSSTNLTESTIIALTNQGLEEYNARNKGLCPMPYLAPQSFREKHSCGWCM